MGLHCHDTGIVGIDIDVVMEGWADEVNRIVADELGPAPRRVGRAPKLLRLYRCDPGMPYAQMKFDDGRPGVVDKKGKVKQRMALVEVLAGETKWFVAEGIHPDTKKPYQWLDPLPHRDELTFVTPEDVERCLARLAAELPKATRPKKSSGPRSAEQEALRGDPHVVATAMRHIPNDASVTGYAEWTEIGAALNGALPDHHALGLELFEEFTDKADIAEPTDTAARVYDSYDDDKIRLGANYIYDHAQKHGWDGKGRPVQWFEANPEVEPDLPEQLFPYGGEEPAAEVTASAPLRLVDARTVAPRDFLYGTHIVRRFASMTVAPSKVGKSTLATVDVLAMVTGRTLLPRMRPKRALRVWYINGEDPPDELLRRFVAAALKYGITNEDIGDRLIVDSGRSLRIVTVVEQKGAAVVMRPVVEALIAELRRLQIDVLVIDPFVSTHRVKENDNTAIEAVVQEWIGVADAAGVGIEIIHHSRKAAGGEEPDGVVDSARGASAMVAKMRSVRALSQMSREQGKRLGLPTSYRALFRVTDAASNLAPWADDEAEWLKKESVDLGNGPGGELERWSEGDHVAVVVPWSLVRGDAGTETDRAKVLEALGIETWREDAQARDEWVGHAIAAALRLDLSDDEEKASVKRMIGSWIKDGTLERVQLQDKKRQKRWYVKARSVLD